MKKAHIHSVTVKPCRCGALERLASKEGRYVRFNEVEGCYNYTWQRAEEPEPYCTMPIYHCHSCGGVAPTKPPKPAYHTISDQEQRRLDALTASIETIDQCEAILGPPDRVDRDRFGYAERELRIRGLRSAITYLVQRVIERVAPDLLPPEHGQYYVRRYVYTKISEVATIWVWDDTGRARISFQPKPLTGAR